MLLAAIGIYGLFSYWVAMRENEIAVRLALGARPSIILRWVGLRALRLAAAGIAFGLAGAWIAARGLEDVVFGIAPRNPVTMLAAALPSPPSRSPPPPLPAWRARASTRPAACTPPDRASTNCRIHFIRLYVSIQST